MKQARLWNRFWAFAGGVTVSFKIMGIVLVLILLFGLVITFQVRNSLTTTLTEELEKRGIAITKHIATHSTELILTGNSYDLYQTAKDTVKNEEAVRYVLVLDANGNVLSHTFSGGVPTGLTTVNQVKGDIEFQLMRLDTNEGQILDIAVPVFGGRVGIARVGMSTHSLHEAVGAMTIRWLIVTAIVSLVGLLAAYFLTSLLTRPIKHLVEVTKAISRGDLKRKAPVWAQDEIGRLGIAFNTMTESLAKSHSEREAFQSELVRRNLELAALNAIATELSGSLELTATMRRSLEKILEFINLDAGWVSIFTEDGERATTISYGGLSPKVVQRIDNLDTSTCNCREAITRKSPIVASGDDNSCPVLREKLDNGEEIRGHVTVPLISKSRVLGLLHVASSEPSRFSPEDIQLLGAMGHQMGVAIENANLWEELRRRDKMRGHLLEEIISAQEAERKRIARELHDQTGQSLTSLMVGLKVLEADSPAKIRERITGMRHLTAQTLEEVHNLSLELRPSSLDDLGLITALEQYTKEYATKFGIETEFQAIGFGPRLLSPEVDIALYRIVQEALTNVVKHAKAEKVSVLLKARNSSIVAIVEDNGRGFDTRGKSESSSRMERLGLYGMYERAELIGGALTIESKPGAGTTVFVEVPINADGSQ